MSKVSSGTLIGCKTPAFLATRERMTSWTVLVMSWECSSELTTLKMSTTMMSAMMAAESPSPRTRWTFHVERRPSCGEPKWFLHLVLEHLGPNSVRHSDVLDETEAKR